MDLRNLLPRVSVAWPKLGEKAVTMTRDGAPYPLDDFAGGVRTAVRSAREENDGNSVVYSCTRVLSMALLQAPLRAWDGEKPVERHPIEALYRQPNPQISGARMWPFALASMMLEGNAYIRVLDQTNAGEPTRLQPLAPWDVSAKTNDDDEVTEWRIIDNSRRTIRLEADEIIHIPWGIDPAHKWKGIAPVRSVLTEVLTDNEATRYSHSVLRNGFGAGVVVMPDGDYGGLDDEERAALKAKWQSEVGGSGRGGVLIASDPMKFQAVGYSPEQIAVDKLQRVPEQRICMAFGVPAIIAQVGAGLERYTYSNYQTALDAFLQFTMVPIWDHLANELQGKLLNRYAGTRPLELRYDLKKVPGLQEEQSELHDRVGKDYRNGILKRGEAREVLGFAAGPEDDVYATEALGVGAVTDAKAKGRQSRWRYEADARPQG